MTLYGVGTGIVDKVNPAGVHGMSITYPRTRTNVRLIDPFPYIAPKYRDLTARSLLISEQRLTSDC